MITVSPEKFLVLPELSLNGAIITPNSIKFKNNTKTLPGI